MKFASLALQMGGAAPNPQMHPKDELELAAECREAAALLSKVAAAYEGSAGLKQAMVRFGYGHPSWEKP